MPDIPQDVLPSQSTAQKMTRDDLYNMISQIVDKGVKDALKQGKEEGDKLLKDTGQDGIWKMIQSAIRGDQNSLDAQESFKKNKAARVGRILGCLAKARNDKHAAEEMAKLYADDLMVQKTIQASDFTSGGALLEPGFYNELTEYLRARTVVRKMGATSIGLVNGTMTLPYISSGTSASYLTAEGSPPNATTLEFGQLVLSAKKLLALVPISNDWLRSPGGGSFGGANLVGQDLARAVGVSEDAAFIRSTGAAGEPKGLRYWAIAANVKAQTKAGGTVTVAEAGYDLSRLQYLLRAQNVELIKGGYIFSPRTWLALITGRDANSNLIWAPEMIKGTLLGQQFAETTSVPDNLGGGSDSEIIYAAFDSVVIGEDENLLADLFDGVAYVDSSGTVKSGVSQDESVMRVISKHDFGCRHRGKEISVLTGVDWTALA